MKANRRCAPPLALAAALLAALTASCTDTRVIPPPTPPRSLPVTTPRYVPPATPAPLPPLPPASQDWRNAPITPGDWTWSMEGGQSVARFAGGLLMLRCDRAAGTIVLVRSGAASGPQPMTVTTTAVVRTVSVAPLGTSAMAAALGARDPLIDAMAFSRGRFAVDTPGQTPLYVPSWPEISRVAEDCR